MVAQNTKGSVLMNIVKTHGLTKRYGEADVVSGLDMEVADMDFAAAPEVLKELEKRLSHGVFGYSVIPEEWYGAICGWWRERHSFQMEKD